MTFLPIVERELRVTARLTTTYRNRMLTPVIVAALSFLRVWLTPTPGPRSLIGPALFHTLSTLTLAFCILEGVRKTADCLSGEKREGTLGLLFLTDLQGYDVILGKLSAAALSSFCALFAILPILGLSFIFFGGITFGELWRVGLASVAVLCFSLIVGVWVSARSYSASRAMTATFLVVLLILLAPIPTGSFFLTSLSPARAFVCSADAVYKIHPLEYWSSLLLTLIWSWGFLSNASRMVNRFREEGHNEQGIASADLGNPLPSAKTSRRKQIRTKLLGVNPILWLASRGENSSLVAWALALVTGLGIAGFGALTVYSPWNKSNTLSPFILSARSNAELAVTIFVAVMNSLINVLLAAQACRCLAEARRNATLEALLCTPLRVDQILQGQVLALRRMFLRPLLLLLACEVVGLFGMIYETGGGVLSSKTVNTLIVAETIFIIFFLLEIQAVAWVGMWFGLCSKNESRAMFKTIFYVILLPYALLVLYCVGAGFFFAWPVASLAWARLNLQEHFRSLAGHRATSSNESLGWVPFELPALAAKEPIHLSQPAQS